MKSLRENWEGTFVVVVAAATLGLVARWILLGNPGWASLGWGLAGAVALVAANAYRTSRDPALLWIAAGAGALSAGWLTYAAAEMIDPSSTSADLITKLSSLGNYEVFLAPLVLAICLAVIVPLRDRRGRRPLRTMTAVASVGVPSVVIAIALVATTSSPGTQQVRVLAVATVIVGGVAAVRSVVRGGWYGWAGGGAFALALAGAGAALFVGADTTTTTLQAATAWFLYLPSVATVMLLLGVLAAQRDDASRMRRASDRATQVMEGRAEIASVVAHDVRGPAATIRSVSGSLRTSYDRLADPERLEFVRMIEQESLRLLQVADQMSLGLKTDAGTLVYDFVVRDLEGPVLQGLHDADAGEREIRVDIDASLSGPIDGRWLTEAVRQGIENAMKFSPSDTPMDLRVQPDEAGATIEIEDRGPGIPHELREQIFQKFCRWRPTGYEDQPGSGLGLFIVRSIARAHHGDATIADGTDGGTILQIRLPLGGMT